MISIVLSGFIIAKKNLPFRIIKTSGYQQNADSCPVVFSGRMAVCTLKNKQFLLGADFKHLGAA
jgi:hypothetical protein